MDKIGVNIKVSGIVQGVGFRPFIHKQITDHYLCGWIRNTSTGALLRLEGKPDEIDAFIRELWIRKPPLALIESVETEPYEPLENFDGFRILPSLAGEKRDTLISPDVCTCDDCLRELFDPSNRRYRYPFINCTNCGPRFTIIRDIPYDRDKTTMAKFPMCGTCYSEYTTITDRRYHAQPNCCSDCGPRLKLLDADGQEIAGDPIRAAREMLSDGKILAVKGLGGFHLACRADLPELCSTLRSRKHRDEKPFALMCADLSEVREICEVTPGEERMLQSHARPIVLLRKKREAAAALKTDICGYLGHISENDRIGIMLPYTPVHFLLLKEGKGPKTLVMTSANLSDRPIIYRNEEALSELHGIADGYLLHNRDIHVRCDDSVMWVVNDNSYFARRSRGYVPYPLILESARGEMTPVLACGAEQKATFSISKGGHIFSSQHIGDLKNIETLENFESQIRHFEKLFEIRPEILVCDLHPDYLSSVYAEERAEREGLPLLRVQHHYAHMASCMADNGLDEPVIGIIWDGTGLGTDHTAWGGEFLTGDYTGFQRQGRLACIPLPGGDRSVHEIWRIGAALLAQSFSELPDSAVQKLPITSDKIAMVRRQMESGINCPQSSSIGRLFDGVSALLGIRGTAGYEGQGAILLEAAADKDCTEELPWTITETGGLFEIDYRLMIRSLVEQSGEECNKSRLAAMFMNTLVSAAAEMAVRIRQRTGISKVVLSGGSFQNQYILQRLLERLPERGFKVYIHRHVSPNDEGLSLGQLMIAARRQKLLR